MLAPKKNGPKRSVPPAKERPSPRLWTSASVHARVQWRQIVTWTTSSSRLAARSSRCAEHSAQCRSEKTAGRQRRTLLEWPRPRKKNAHADAVCVSNELICTRRSAGATARRERTGVHERTERHCAARLSKLETRVNRERVVNIGEEGHALLVRQLAHIHSLERRACVSAPHCPPPSSNVRQGWSPPALRRSPAP